MYPSQDFTKEVFFLITTSLYQGTNVDATATVGSGYTQVVNTTEVTNTLDNRPELTGSNREKLISTVQDPKLNGIVDELYRPDATIGDGGTAAVLKDEFSQGSSKHLQKAQDRLKQFQKLAKSKNLGLNDMDICENLIYDLENSINLFGKGSK